MNFELRSFKSAGPVAFGMSRDQARKALGVPWVTFMKTSVCDLPSDHFESIGVLVYYKLPDVVEAVEFVPPANPVFDGMNLLQERFGALKRFLLSKDLQLTIDPDGLTSNRLGIGVYATDAIDDPLCLPEAIIAFEKGYYD